MIRCLFALVALTCIANVSFAQCDMRDPSCMPAKPGKLSPVADPISTPGAADVLVSPSVPGCFPDQNRPLEPATSPVGTPLLEQKLQLADTAVPVSVRETLTTPLVAETLKPALVNRA